MTDDRARFVFLDGMRGTAALAVAWLHATQIFKFGGAPDSIALAVDFFFCLSGFVVAYAYDGRLRSDMDVKTFMTRRMIRLYPMIFAGVVLGVAAALVVQTRGLGEIAALGVTGTLLIPLGLVDGHLAYPINSPMWSLFFELFACLAYAIGARVFAPKWADWLLAPLGLLLCGAIFAAGDATSLGVSGVPHFIAGFFRVAYPFLAGVLFFRWSLHRRVPAIPAVFLALVLLGVLFMPIHASPWYDMAAVIVLLPGLVILGAAAKVSAVAFWDLLGRLSYPLYLVHYPVLKVVEHVTQGSGLPAQVAAIGAVILSIGVAHLALTLYDIPLRKRLTDQVRLRNARVAATS